MSVAVGHNASSAGNGSIAIGAKTGATYQATAIGNNALAAGQQASHGEVVA